MELVCLMYFKKSGSISSILSGKNYSRAMNCHKELLESLERLLLGTFMSTDDGKVSFSDETVEKIE